MLTFEEKLAIVETFPDLQRKDVSLGRVNFHYENSRVDKKIVVYHLHPNGNGFVYAGHLTGHEMDDKGMVNIREYSSEELWELIEASINSLSPKSEIDLKPGSEAEEHWMDANNQTLILKHEDELWNVYFELNLDSAFETYEEAEQYLLEEGFTLIS